MSAPSTQGRDLVVQSITPESDGVLGLELVDPHGAELPAWTPGAHIALSVPGGAQRQYSLCGDPADRLAWRIGVLREERSRGGSEWVHTRLRPGDQVTVGDPVNNFALRPRPSYLFVAGGIGITPLLPMIQLVEARGADWRLVYGGRRRASMAFTGELARYGDRVQLWPEDEHGLIDLDRLVAGTHPDTGIYCCGPEALLAALEKRCLGRSPGSLRTERFAPKPAPDDLPANGSFQVELAATGGTVDVGAAQSIIEALEADGVQTSGSCLEGTCGSCETAVLDGVPEHRDSILAEDERDSARTMMICVSRARTARLVLDL